MTERYIFIFQSSSLVSSRLLSQKYSSLILSRSFALSSSSLSVNQLIKHFQSKNQMCSSLAISQGFLIIDKSNHVSITEISKHLDKRSDESSNPLISVNQSIEQSKGQSSMRHSSRESSITRNFLRQSLSSSSQSAIQEILSSEISEISQNLYDRQSRSLEISCSDSSSQSENLYIRQFSSKNFYTRLSENFYTFIIHRRCDIE